MNLFDHIIAINQQTRLCPICKEPLSYELVESPLRGQRPWKKYTTQGHEECHEKSLQQEIEHQNLLAAERKELQSKMLIRDAFALTELNPEKRSWESLKQNEHNKEIYAKAENWKAGETGYMLHGQAGSGKTHLVCALVQRIIRRDHTPCIVIHAKPFLDKILLSGFEDSEDLIKKIMEVPVLIIDDFGAGNITEAADERMQRILDARLEFDRSTWATTNLAGQAFKEKLTPRTCSRALALMKPFSLTGTDYRLKGVK